MQRWLIALVLVAIVLVVYAPIVLGGSTWDDAPYHTEIAPPRIAAADAVLHGESPTWWEGSALGVPLLAEPSHGAAYPIGWLAATPLTFDLLLVLHVLWCALGVALLARRLGASDLGAVIAGVLVATSGVIVSAALRGALPALAHLPWLAFAAMRLAAARDHARARMLRVRAAIAIAVLLGLVGLAGQLVVLAVGLAVVLALQSRARIGLLAIAILAGLAIATVQWIPALLLDDVVGRELPRLSAAHAIDLVFPRHGGGWFPSLYAGAPALALAVLGKPSLRFALLGATLLVVGFVVHGGDVCIAAFTLLAAAHAGRGFDRISANVRPRLRIAIVAVVLAPTVAVLPLQFPTTDRAVVAEPNAWAKAAARITAWPRRLFRPVMTFPGKRDPGDRSLDDRLATLGGTSAAKWGIGAARSEDPARSRVHDRVWSAAAAAGGALFGRYGIALAILPASMVGDSGGAAFKELSRRAPWALVEYPASPTAAVVYEWLFAPDVETALARLYPPGTDRGLSAGVIVLSGQGPQQQDEPGPPQPCKTLRWDAGAIDLECSADRPAYAVISSSAARGWSATIDGRATPWLVADVVRRAVPLTPGTHQISWRYAAPGLRIALVLAALGIVALVALFLLRGRDSDARDRTPDPERTDVN